MQATLNFEMIKEGDRVLVCLSGGKDSLSLLHAMRQYQHSASKKGINFKIKEVQKQRPFATSLKALHQAETLYSLS